MKQKNASLLVSLLLGSSLALGACASLPQAQVEPRPEPTCVLTEHLRMVSSSDECYCKGCPAWAVTQGEHEARRAAWERHCGDFAALYVCITEECEAPGSAGASAGQCVGPSAKEAPDHVPRYWEERVSPDAQVWSAERVAELHARLETMLTEGRYAEAFDLAIKRSVRWGGGCEQPLVGGLLREDFVATMEPRRGAADTRRSTRLVHLREPDEALP